MRALRTRLAINLLQNSTNHIVGQPGISSTKIEGPLLPPYIRIWDISTSYIDNFKPLIQFQFNLNKSDHIIIIFDDFICLTQRDYLG